MPAPIKVFLYEIKNGEFIPFYYDTTTDKNVLNGYEDNSSKEEKDTSVKTVAASTDKTTTPPPKGNHLYNMLIHLLENQYFEGKFEIDKSLLEKGDTKDNNYPYAQLEEEEKAIAIVFTTMEQLTLAKTYQNFVEVPFRKMVDENKEINNRYPLPMIMIGTKDIMGIYTEERKRKKKENVIYSLNLDDRFKFFDSNIWHYYVPIGEKFDPLLKNALQRISQNFNLQLYHTNVSLEDLEIQLRLLTNSYIIDFGSGHGKKVTPFKFHSEATIRQEVAQLWNGHQHNGKYKIGLKAKFKGLQWRFLLIDDFANKHLKQSEQNTRITKSAIIRNLLEEVGLTTTAFEPDDSQVNPSNIEQRIPNTVDVLIEYKEPIQDQETRKQAVKAMQSFLEKLDLRTSIIRNDTAVKDIVLYKRKNLQAAQSKVLKDFKEIVENAVANGTSSTSGVIQEAYIPDFEAEIQEYLDTNDIVIKEAAQLTEDKFVAHIAIEYAHQLEEAKALLKQRKFKIYDIILLDYLLRDQHSQPEYGTTLLKDIQENLEIEKGGNQFQASVLNNFWVFPTSSFSYAMLDAIYERGISHFDEHWFLASGVNPVDTPEMFKFKLLKFMQAQLAEAGYEEISRGANQTGMITEQVHIFDYLAAIFDHEDIESQARKHYPELVRLQSKFEDLYQNRKKSPFAASVIKVIYKRMTADMWNHLLYLTYFVGYGNSSQWPQMWEEYKLLKTRFDREGIQIPQTFEQVFGKIGHYISKLETI